MAGREKKGLQLGAHQIIVRPLVTEKGTHQSEKHNAYSFEVHPQSTKTQVRQAVEELWNVRVLGVRTLNRKGKPRRHKMSQGSTSDWKKAVVKLHPDDKMAFF
jgi:large subunit ribosomal protein L23